MTEFGAAQARKDIGAGEKFANLNINQLLSFSRPEIYHCTPNPIDAILFCRSCDDLSV
jgi:hypothetical protein